MDLNEVNAFSTSNVLQQDIAQPASILWGID
jgi:hypothetical protein